MIYKITFSRMECLNLIMFYLSMTGKIRYYYEKIRRCEGQSTWTRGWAKIFGPPKHVFKFAHCRTPYSLLQVRSNKKLTFLISLSWHYHNSLKAWKKKSRFRSPILNFCERLKIKLHWWVVIVTSRFFINNHKQIFVSVQSGHQ